MSNITLEKVDAVKDRTFVSYAEAKEALEACNGEVLDAIIYIEDKYNKIEEEQEKNTKKNETVEEFKAWLKDLIEKGDITRIKLKKDEKELLDIPVNAGIAATVIAVVLPPVLAFGVIAAVATKITVEITKEDGSVEVVNKYVSKAANDVKEKASQLAEKVKEKLKNDKEKEKVYTGTDTVYSYTVNFDQDESK